MLRRLAQQRTTFECPWNSRFIHASRAISAAPQCLFSRLRPSVILAPFINVISSYKTSRPLTFIYLSIYLSRCNYFTTWLASPRSEAQAHVCLPVRSTPWGVYYNTALIFHSRVWYLTLSVRYAYIQSSGIILIPYATCVPNFVSFATSIAELAMEKNCVLNQSVNQSPSLFDAVINVNWGSVG